MVDLSTSELYRKIPLGDKVAREFPWWREGTIAFPISAAGLSRRFVVGPQSTVFKSDRESPIKIHEVRFQLDTTGERQIAGELLTSVRMFHSKYDIVNRWMPTITFNTEENRLHVGDAASLYWKLPAPYFLQRDTAFKMTLLPLTATIASRDIEVALRGYDPLNDTDIVMNKVVTMPAANTPVNVVFDEDRDKAVRNIWIHDIVFGFTEVNAAATPRSIASHLRVRFNPVKGPKWTKDETAGTLLSGLVECDSGISAAGVYRPTVIHRPPTPYILNPREVLTIELRNDAAFSTTNTFYCWVVGTQEGRY